MESLAFTTLAATSFSSRISNSQPKFCPEGCVKCSPVSLSLWSSFLSSLKRSECSSSSTSFRESLLYGEQFKAVEKVCTVRTNRRISMRSARVAFVDQCGSDNSRDSNAHMTNEQDPKRLTNGHATSIQAPMEDVSARGMELNGISSNRVTTSSVVEKTIVTEKKNVDVDELWLEIKAEARLESEKEPALASYFYSSVISHKYGHFRPMFTLEMFKHRNSIQGFTLRHLLVICAGLWSVLWHFISVTS